MIDWIKLFNENGVSYSTHGKEITAGWIGIYCYTCRDASRTKLGINLISGGCSCWSCGKKSPLEVIQNTLRISYDESRIIYRKYISKNSSIVRREKTRGGASVLSIPNLPLNEREKRYLQSRGIGSRYFIDTYEITSGGISGDFSHRIVLPIYYKGIPVSATARTIHKGVEPKYWTLPPEKEVVHHKHILYNWDDAGEFPIVVEGPIDSLKGGPGFVSPFGAQVTEEQLLLLATKKKIFTLFDSDDTGRKQGRKYAEYLNILGVEVEMLWLNSGHDIGAMELAEIDEIRNETGLESIYD